MSKLDSVYKELLRVLLMIKQHERILGNNAEVIVKDVGRENLGVSLISFII